ncbi:hypothetical protein HDU87_000189 [Geranomyces variabilis]|uniref:Uncharacterized protein n=1 Tax=Geranomyces variabilis TaxID=109894 RepID=A0AAD5TS50_9FUNG|nr:hypothetical protein HDU87_000189 [Geranomyces variabilis]
MYNDELIGADVPVYCLEDSDDDDEPAVVINANPALPPVPPSENGCADPPARSSPADCGESNQHFLLIGGVGNDYLALFDGIGQQPGMRQEPAGMAEVRCHDHHQGPLMPIIGQRDGLAHVIPALGVPRVQVDRRRLRFVSGHDQERISVEQANVSVRSEDVLLFVDLYSCVIAWMYTADADAAVKPRPAVWEGQI